MNCFYALMRDRHASKECLLGEQELFLITAGKKEIAEKTQTNHQKQSSPLFGACCWWLLGRCTHLPSTGSPKKPSNSLTFNACGKRILPRKTWGNLNKASPLLLEVLLQSSALGLEPGAAGSWPAEHMGFKSQAVCCYSPAWSFPAWFYLQCINRAFPDGLCSLYFS